MILVDDPKYAPAGDHVGVGLYARVCSHDQEADLERRVGRLSQWVSGAGLPVVRTEAEIGSGMNGARAKVRRLLARETLRA